jgi:predicted secreted protein
MTKAEFKRQLITLLATSVDGLSDDDKPPLVRRAVTEFEKEQTWDQSNTRAPWSDDELRVVLSRAPTHENTLRLAKAFKRGYGSIEQIYRWAGQSERRIAEARAEDSFVQHIRRIRKELGWRSVGGDK